MNSTIRTFATLILLTTSLACGKEEPKKAASPTCDLTSVLCSCDLRATSEATCKDFEGITQESAQGSCAGGTFSSSALCPTASRVGTCKNTLVGAKTHIRYYADAAAAASACTILGVTSTLTGSFEWTGD